VKTTRRSFAIVLVLVLAFVLVAACQTIDGACWLPDSQGQGGGPGGPIVPAGVGGYGDMPTGGGGYGAGYVPCPTQDDSCPLTDIRCPNHDDWGATCMEECAINGNPCPASQRHTITNARCLLYRCNGCTGNKQCWYANPNNVSEVCVYRPETQSLLCRD
jgi:predicted small secreted protein